MPLSDTRIRNQKATEKPYKLTDSGGPHLEVKPTGAKLWRYRYRIAGKENVFAMGAYPAMTLAEARQAREDARKLVKQGIYPAHQRKAERIQREHQGANTFEAIRARMARSQCGTVDATHEASAGAHARARCIPAHRVAADAARDTRPSLDTLKRIDTRAPSFAVLAKQCIGGIASYAVSTLRGDGDPSAPLKGVLKVRPVKHKTPLTLSEIRRS